MTEPSTVIVDKDLRDKFEELWATEKTNKHFESIGKFKLKGFKAEKELFKFNWTLYAKDDPENTLASRVFNCLRDAGMTPTNLCIRDLALPGFIIWPVVPRTTATAIHRGQIEVMRLLTFLGWRIHLLVADCGGSIKVTKTEIDSFTDMLLKQAAYRGLHDIEHSCLSKYFEGAYPDHQDVLDKFQKITTNMTVQDLLYINQKEYKEEIQKEIIENPTLDFLRPILTCGVALHLSELWLKTHPEAKTIIVSGVDEQIQWGNIFEVASRPLGAIYNPILKESAGGGISHNVRQKNEWPIWRSKEELDKDMTRTNAGKWVFQLFAQLGAFPASQVTFADKGVRSRDWQDEFSIPGHIDRTKLVDLVWPILDPARRE